MKVADVKCLKLRKSVTSEDVEERARSIAEHSLLSPILLDKKLNVIAGATRFHAIRDVLGWTEIEEKDFRIIDGNSEAITLVENFSRKDLSMAEMICAIEELTKNHSIEECAKMISHSVQYVKRRLSLKKLIPEIKGYLVDGGIQGMKLEHFEFISTLTEKDQEAIVEHLHYMDMSKFKKEVMTHIAHDLSELPYPEKGCGKCSFCKDRENESILLFDELKGQNICTDTNYLDLKKEEWIDSLTTLKVTENYYSNNTSVITSGDYEIVEEGGEEATNVNTGEVIRVKTSKEVTAKQGPRSREELVERKHKQRLKWIVENKIIPDLDKLPKSIKANLMFVYSTNEVKYGIQGLEDLENDKTPKFEYVMDLTRKKLEKELISTLNLTFIAKALKLNMDKALDAATIALPDPASWSK